MRRVWVRCEESGSNSKNKEETGRDCLRKIWSFITGRFKSSLRKLVSGMTAVDNCLGKGGELR